MKKHIIWMIIGCGLPLLLIFFAPALGITGNTSLFIFIIVMFACHLMMPMHNGGHRHDNHNANSKQSKTEKYASHQH